MLAALRTGGMLAALRTGGIFGCISDGRVGTRFPHPNARVCSSGQEGQEAEVSMEEVEVEMEVLDGGHVCIVGKGLCKDRNER
jgi:hypothetical protein